MKARTRTYLSVSMLVLFVSYFIGITAFTHVHFVNGVMVVHSHPFASSTHQHTTSQLVLIGLFDHLTAQEAESFSWKPIEKPVLYALTFPSQVSVVTCACLQGLRLRAPPACPVPDLYA